MWFGSDYFYNLQDVLDFIDRKEITCIGGDRYQCNGFIFSAPRDVGIKFWLRKLVHDKAKNVNLLGS
jgi:hypothetical protein